jgi:sugar/nucleoside kinase (ribokinase family)
MIIVFGDLLVDLSLRLEHFPLRAGEMQQSPFVELGPGGACNVAIACRRFGLDVTCLGEIGDDEFGEIVRRGLAAEGIDVRQMAVSSGTRTPLAGVLVDEAGEPAYIGFPGTLGLGRLLSSWEPAIESAQGVFTDGWAEHPGAARMRMDFLQRAGHQGVPTFFDPGPGNPALDNSWHREAIGATKILLLNLDEARNLTGMESAQDSAKALGEMGPELVIVKLGASGCLARRGEEAVELPGIPVPLVDATGAGDSVAGAVIYAWLRGLDLTSLVRLANAAGAAKVQKRGTGRNVPTLDEIRAVLQRTEGDPAEFLPG